MNQRHTEPSAQVIALTEAERSAITAAVCDTISGTFPRFNMGKRVEEEVQRIVTNRVAEALAAQGGEALADRATLLRAKTAIEECAEIEEGEAARGLMVAAILVRCMADALPLTPPQPSDALETRLREFGRPSRPKDFPAGATDWPQIELSRYADGYEAALTQLRALLGAAQGEGK